MSGIKEGTKNELAIIELNASGVLFEENAVLQNLTSKKLVAPRANKKKEE